MSVEVFKMRQVAQKGISALIRSASANGMAVVNKDNEAVAIVIPTDVIGKNNLHKLLDRFESIGMNTEPSLPESFDDISIKEYNAKEWKRIREFFNEFNELFKMIT